MDEVPAIPGTEPFDLMMKIVSWNLTGEEYGVWDLALTLSQLFS